MPGRVLNFFEFSDKYSNTSATDRDLEDVTGAASNFADGFDDSTYDQPEIKPNRPVKGNYENTPSAPNGFNPNASNKMSAPEESDKNTKGSKEEEGNPEDSNESTSYVKSFKRYLNEMYDDYRPEELEDDSEIATTMISGYPTGIDPYEVEGSDALGYYPEDYGDNEVCPDCGERYSEDQYGISCGCNM